MLLTCKLFRPGGSRVTLGKGKEAREYHFKPLDSKADVDDPRVDHVCDVNDKDDIGTLLAIKEGYEVHSSEIKKRAAQEATHIAEKQHAAAEKVVEDARAAALAASVAPVAPPPPPKHYAAMGKPDLLKLVAERTGKKPAPTTPRDKLIDRLESLDKQPK